MTQTGGIKKIKEISVKELFKEKEEGKDFFLLDVRTEEEYIAGHLEFTDSLISYEEVPHKLEILPEENSKTIYCFCRTGSRSAMVTEFLLSIGYVNSFNVVGGIVDWVSEGYPIKEGK